MDFKELAVKAAKLLSDKKAFDIKVLDISKLTAIGDYFVICSGGSTTQVKALADNLAEKLNEDGVAPLRTEGYKGCSWVLLDYGGVIVHIFKNDTRDFYNLEHLWGDADKLPVDFN